MLGQIFMTMRSTSSGLKTANAQVITIPGAVCGIDLQAPSTGQANLKVYDSKDSNTTGKLLLAEIFCDAGMSSVNHEFTAPVIANQGIYAELTGTSSYIVRFTVG